MNWTQTNQMTSFYHDLNTVAMESWAQGNFGEAALFFQLEAETRMALAQDFQNAGIKDKGNHGLAIMFAATQSTMANMEAGNL